MNKKVLLVIAAILVIAGNAWAAEPEWFGSLDANGLGQSTDWFDAAMWRNPSAVPTISDKAKINLVWGNPGPVIDAAGADVNQLYVAESSGDLPGAQTLEVTTGGVLGVNAEAVLGYGADDVNNDDGTLLVTGGTVNCNQHLFVGYDPCAIGRLQIDSGTVDVNQMFGLSWNGGNGYAQLNGGTLITEQFTFENVAGGTAAMDITGGTWIQEHFWWNEIRALVYNGKITGYDQRANVVVTWDPVLERTIVTALATPDIVVVKKAGGDYDTIQAALNDAGLVAFDVIEVQDDATYNENLVFPDVNYLTLQAGDGNSPTITVSGVDVNTHYINMKAVGQTIQGFNIDFSGSAYPTDSNSVIILSQGGASTVRDCNITGPTSGWIMGITAVARIEDTEISNCRIGVVCDLNEVESGFRYSITGCRIYDNRLRGISFADCNAVMDNCLIENNGSPTLASANVLTEDKGTVGDTNDLNLLITNSMIRGVKRDRNVCLEAKGTTTIEDCIIMDAQWDEILQYRGTLNLNRCILKCSSNIGACLNVTASTDNPGPAVTNIDHCSIEGSEDSTQWAVFTIHADANVTITNSILTGPQGLLENPGMGEITTNWNDNYCGNPIANEDYISPGPNDINDLAYPYYIGVDPFYIQVNDVNLDTFFALQPYSPVINADENGNYMGAKGVIYGYEEWPGSLDGVYGVDFYDFAVLGLHWREDTTIYPGPNMLIEDFDSYVLSGEPNMFDTWEVVGWYGSDGTSTLSLLTDPNDANSGSNAMRWVYDVNETTGGGLFTEILMVLASEVDLSAYDRIEVMLKRHAGNSPEYDTYMYAKFLNDIYGTYGMGGLDLTGTDPRDVAYQLTGGSTATHPDEYYAWTINLDNVDPNDENWRWGHEDLQHVGAIIFAVESHPDTNELDPNTAPPGGQGTLDVDDISLIDLPECDPPAPPEADLNGDCEVTFADVKIFTDYWLEGK